MRGILPLLFLLAVSNAASVVDEAAADDTALQTDRDGKFLSVFQIVQFKNEECEASDGNTGTCYTEAECNDKPGGTPTGTCASGFGVCCVTHIDPCGDGTIKSQTALLENPGFPDSIHEGTCTNAGGRSFRRGRTHAEDACVAPNMCQFVYKIERVNDKVTQFRFDFLTYETSAPSSGDCSNDTLTFAGMDAVSARSVPMDGQLCGNLTGSHLFLGVEDLGSNLLTVTIKLSSIGTQKWQILLRQFEGDELDRIAPHGCLQYYTEATGTLMSFNNAGGNGELLNDHMYSMCIMGSTKWCDVSFTSNDFELSGSSGSCSDSIALGTSMFCGTTPPLIWNFTGPYIIPFMSDSDNSAMVSGFSLDYTLLPC